MKKIYLGAAFAAVLATTSAFAAAPAAPAAPAPAAGAATAPAAGALTIAAADVTKLKTWITDQKTASVAAPTGFTVAIGSVVPATVTLKAIAITPAVAGVDAMKVQYAVIADKIVLVNVADRKVVYVFA